jgi:hypothetical protein
MVMAGRSVEEARKVTREALVGRVGPLPRAKAICYDLAVLALSDALEKLRAHQSERTG